MLIHVMNVSKLSVSSACILSFTSFGSFPKLLTLHYKIVNNFDKQYSKILLGNLNITTEFMFLKNPLQYIKFINKYIILMPNILSIILSPYLEHPPEPTYSSLFLGLTSQIINTDIIFDYGINNTTQHSISYLICSCLIKYY